MFTDFELNITMKYALLSIISNLKSYNNNGGIPKSLVHIIRLKKKKYNVMHNQTFQLELI